MKTTGIIASGPSVTVADVVTLKALCDEVGTINKSYRSLMSAQWLYTNDPDWLADEADGEILRWFDGTVYCGYWGDWNLPSFVNREYRAVKHSKPLLTQPGRLAWGGNSGYAAINLAYHLGARRVILLGYDQKGAHYTAHHHAPHPDHIKKPFNWPMWHGEFAKLAKVAPDFGLEIINATRDTALTCFKQMTLEELC